MRKVLIPFDGSDNALRAVHYGAAMAQEKPSLELELLCVLDPMTLRSHANMNQAEITRLYIAEATALLEPAQQVLNQYGVSCEQHYRIGDPASEIAAQVHEKNFDGVIMGTRGMGQLANLMIGSVATRVVHLVHVPVTLIK